MNSISNAKYVPDATSDGPANQIIYLRSERDVIDDVGEALPTVDSHLAVAQEKNIGLLTDAAIEILRRLPPDLYKGFQSKKYRRYLRWRIHVTDDALVINNDDRSQLTSYRIFVIPLQVNLDTHGALARMLLWLCHVVVCLREHNLADFIGIGGAEGLKHTELRFLRMFLVAVILGFKEDVLSAPQVSDFVAGELDFAFDVIARIEDDANDEFLVMAKQLRQEVLEDESDDDSTFTDGKTTH